MSVMTTTASVGSDQAAYDRFAYFALRPEMYADGLADVKPTRQAMPGSSVIFTHWADLSVATAALNESVDVDAVALSDSTVSVTLVERGNAVVTSAKLRGTSFLDVDEAAANIVGYNAGTSLDSIIMAELNGGTNVRYSGQATARNRVIPTDKLTASDVRRALADLRSASVQTWANGYYKSLIHPDVSYDLRSETGAAAWRDPHTYSQPGEIWTGSIGAFEGFEFVETPRAGRLADAGSSTTLTDVYQTLFMGRQGLAKAYSSEVSGERPKVERGPIVDKLSRFHPIGWYWLGGYGRFREAAIRRVESASTIGANA